MIELHIPEPTPSVNKLHGQHWSKRLKARKRWAWLVRASRMNVRVPMLPPEHCNLTIERYGARILDHDNYVGGCKWLLDSIVAEGFAVDDSPAHMTAEYRQFVGKPHRTIVKIQGDTQWNHASKAALPSSSPRDTATPATSSKNAIVLAEALL